MNNLSEIQTERLILRRFTEDDAEALHAILSNRDVNRFLPMLLPAIPEQTREYLRENYLGTGEASGFQYAICLKTNQRLIGNVHAAGDDSHDLGYYLKKEYWHQGIAAEACRALIELLQRAGVPYLTATHDVENPNSGAVMRKIGMTYCYSYEEQWQPKNIPVTFRMYQLNLDGQKDRVYRKYWERYPVHFIEDIDAPSSENRPILGKSK